MNRYSTSYMEYIAESLKAIAHPIRLKIIRILCIGPVSVGDLADICEISSSVVSAHLRLMSDRGVVKKERFGRNIFYKVSEPFYGEIINCLI